MLAGTGLGFAAGVLSVLSPCVLPILPLVLGSALGEHRFGGLALSAGLVLAFVGVGLFVATIGFTAGLDGGVFRAVAAVALGLAGVVLLSSRLQGRLALATGRVTGWAGPSLARLSGRGVGGQFLLGVVLGMVWSPCVGPTLGAASLLAAQGKDLGRVGLTMAAFGAGAGLSLLAISRLSRTVLQRWRGRLARGAETGKAVLGGAVLAVSLLILTGTDRVLETFLVTASPDWLTALTTKY